MDLQTTQTEEKCECHPFVNRRVELPYLSHWQTEYQHVAGDVDAAGRDIERNLVNTRASTCLGPETRDWTTLQHEREKDGQAAGQNKASDDSDEAPESVYDEDSPIEEQDSNLDYSYSERPKHHEDIQALIRISWGDRLCVEDFTIWKS